MGDSHFDYYLCYHKLLSCCLLTLLEQEPAEHPRAVSAPLRREPISYRAYPMIYGNELIALRRANREHAASSSTRFHNSQRVLSRPLFQRSTGKQHGGISRARTLDKSRTTLTGVPALVNGAPSAHEVVVAGSNARLAGLLLLYFANFCS